MSNFNLNSGGILQFSVERIAEEIAPGHTIDVVYLEVISEICDVKYRIIGDSRHSIDDIESKLNKFRDTYQKSGSDFSVGEYLERSYIFVTYPDGTTDQYTAKKV